ncbi:PP2C family protein-serine/threonine phosphatase [Nocardioides sp. Kera G14]|uniref:PP2C family protein-serine/threonine phosphatase n=1 Tax=Nocardioides sp. Kera G14 TaxID=2884264 RepID=UPI001D126618|nr:PP2C family protein-serine/threonine phosphatase [Nocardioides sp. Kera G14]UDY25231.1 serine/threonine-protein phosphatase [Nocardioides sp. Kera G14]
MTVLIVGLAVTAALFVASRVNYLRNEHDQLSTQTQLAAASLAVGPVDLQRLLGRAATLVSATGDVQMFEDALTPSLPTPFASVRLFKVTSGTPTLVDSLGGASMTTPTSPESADLIRRAVQDSGSLAVTWLATSTAQRCGYAFSATTHGQSYVAYAEQVLPGDRRVEIPASSPLSNMVFAIYYGKTHDTSALLETNASDLPITGDVARTTIPFGDAVLSAVVTPRSPLLGTFAASIAWVTAGAGTLLTALMALLTDRLQRRRSVAEQLALVTAELYRTQRGVSETLQTALLPDSLPEPPELAVATRYLAGTEGIDVGGDWYDLVRLPDSRLFFTVGDVSGRGLSAATVMSRLRHSITAYAVEGDDPATVLAKVSRLIDVVRDGHFATALCGIVDLHSGDVTVANAGHPPLVLLGHDAGEPVAAPVGPPLGVGSDYETAALSLPRGAVLLAYTDGLVERRDRAAEDGITQLCEVRTAPGTGLEGLLDIVLAALNPLDDSKDDTAILAMQWTPQTPA